MALQVGATKQNSYTVNRAWSDSYTDAVKDIIKKNAMHVVSVSIATDNADMHNATDMTITITGGCVAVRVRRDNTRFRDFTIRSRVRTGAKTELSKLREGFADWYLYCWTLAGKISEWILVDLYKLRKSGLLDKEYKDIPNGDGSFFIAVKMCDLILYNCIVARQGDV